MSNKNNLLHGNPETQFTAGPVAAENGRKGGLAKAKKLKEQKGLRQVAQEILDGTFTDKNGTTMTGREMLQKSLLSACVDPKSRNFGKAWLLLIQLTGADKSAEEIEKLHAEIDLIRSKAKAVGGFDHDQQARLTTLDLILAEMRADAMRGGDTT